MNPPQAPLKLGLSAHVPAFWPTDWGQKKSVPGRHVLDPSPLLSTAREAETGHASPARP